MSGRNRERGFALPFTIFLIGFLTVLLAAAAMRVAADRRIAEAAGRGSSARSIAQSGLQHYIGTRTSRPNDGDSVRVNVLGGYAIVVARIVRNPVDTSANTTYVIRSTGYAVVPALGAEPQASRTVAQFAVWQTSALDLHGAITFIGGVKNEKKGVGNISGVDNCGAKPSITGLRIPTGGSVDTSAGLGFSGSPKMTQSGNSAAVASETDINWAWLIGGAFTPDYTTIKFDNNYSTYLIKGNDTIPQNKVGTGLLIVTGTLTFKNSNSFVSQGWKGVVLVGDSISFSSKNPFFGPINMVYGQTIAGLNQLTGGNPGKSDIDNYSLDLRYDSCEISKALAGISGLSPVSNAWVENWASW